MLALWPQAATTAQIVPDNTLPGENSSVSRIDGLLGVNGRADLFFLNPNGVILLVSLVFRVGEGIALLRMVGDRMSMLGSNSCLGNGIGDRVAEVERRL